MMKHREKSWFTVKIVFRWTAFGRSKVQTPAFVNDATLVEERILLFQAVSAAEAIRLGEKEAKAYTGESYINPAGQKVKIRALKDIEVYELTEPPQSGSEVFSSTELVSKSISDRAVVVAKFGQLEKKNKQFSSSHRMKFCNREFWGDL